MPRNDGVGIPGRQARSHIGSPAAVGDREPLCRDVVPGRRKGRHLVNEVGIDGAVAQDHAPQPTTTQRREPLGVGVPER